MWKIFFYTLLFHMFFAENVNIANCDELWGMTNSMNAQPLYSVKIYSCIVNPLIQNGVINTNLNSVNTISNISTFNSTNTIFNSTNISQPILLSPSPVTGPSPVSAPSPVTTSSPVIAPSPVTAPSSVINIKNDDSINDIMQVEIIDTSQFASNHSNQTTQSLLVEKTSNITGLIIGFLIFACIIIVIFIFIMKKHKKNRIEDNLKKDTLKNHATPTNPHKPHILNASQVSSKTDDTLVNGPHPPPENKASKFSKQL